MTDIIEQAAVVVGIKQFETTGSTGSNTYAIAQALADAGLLRDGVTPEHIAQQREKGWLDIHPEDYCHRCGNPNPSWATPRTEWETATQKWAQQTGREGICCPSCFDQMHQEATGKPVTWWIHPWQGEPCTQPTRTVPTREQIAKRIHPGYGRPRYDSETCASCERAGEIANAILALFVDANEHTNSPDTENPHQQAKNIVARTVPTRDEIAAALSQATDDGASRTYEYADAVLALIADQPTVEDVRLEAVAEERIRNDNGNRTPLEALMNVAEVEPSTHYCSDIALQEMIDSPHIPEDRKPAMRAELRQRKGTPK